MTPCQLKPPSPTTLKKYGLSIESWCAMGDLQDWRCPVCGEEFNESRRPVIDHEHVRNFKKMTAENKSKYVRGLLHNFCNYRLVAKGMTAERAYGIYTYLSDYNMRRFDN